jgi:hypothetical protein
LIGVTLAREEGFAFDELTDDATNGPDVNGSTVREIGAQQELRTTIPTSDDIFCERVLSIVPREGDLVNEPCQAKVCDAELTIFTHENVPRLEITICEEEGEERRDRSWGETYGRHRSRA